MENIDDDSGGGKNDAPFDDTTVRPVSPHKSGEGLPYAPVNWPNPGDNWNWRVRHRLLKNGTFRDRSLSVPPRLQKKGPNKIPEFQSKRAIARYLRSEFPKADICAFFESFSWEIPAKPELYYHCPPVKRSRVKKLENNRGREVFKQKPKDGISSGSKSSKASTSSPCRQLPDDSPLDCNVQINNVFEEFEGDPSPEEFDNYLKSLDEIINDMPFQMHQSCSKDEVMTHIRKKLSSLLAMGIDCLLSSDHVNEFITLTYKLQNDPSLEAKELSMLKLIQSVPFTSKSFLEAKQLSSKADNFLDGLDAKIASLALLKEEYNATKDEVETIKADEASTLLDIMDIDHEISKLETHRREKAEMIKANSKKLIHLTSIQTSVMRSIPKIVHEVQIAKSEKSIWELKKKKAAEEVVEILARFAPLEGFSF